MTKSNPFEYHLMRVSDVKAHVTDKAKFETFRRYIHIEETRPYDELNDYKTYVSCKDLETVIPAAEFRQLQCDKTSYFCESRWIMQVSHTIEIGHVVVGAMFRTANSIVWIIDEIEEDAKFGRLVRTSMHGGKKGNYRDPIEEVVAFLNEEKSYAL